MTDANRILEAAVMAEGQGACNCERRRVYFRPIVVAALRELAKRPDDWNRYELADMADEIEGKSDD